jgi:hypothetical protein
MVKISIKRWRVTVLLAFLALLVGFPVASASAAAASTGWIRLANLSTTTPPVDVYVYPSGSSAPLIVLHDYGYGTVSPYEVVGAGGYSVSMRTAGSSATSAPVLSASLTVAADHSYTAAALAGTLKVLNDSLTTPKGASLVRVIQASKQPAVTFHCSCAAGAPGDITTNAASGSVSAYATIPVGTWTMTATGPTAKASAPVTLVADTVHTELVLDTSTGIEVVDVLDAAGMLPPSGGVSTGFGGAAPHGPGSTLPWLAVIGAGALLTLAGGGWWLRRGRLRGLTASA